MEELKITANDLYKLMKSYARLGFAAGASSKGHRTMANTEQKIIDTIEDLKKTHRI